MKEFRLLNKVLAVLLTLLMFASCTQTLPTVIIQTPTAEPTGSLSLPYCASDSLNPFFSEGTDNQQLWPLAFLPLYELDENFTPQPILADSAVQNGNSLQITLRAGILTAQGTPLSIADVLYSFRLAKESPAFKRQLSVFTNIAIGQTADVLLFTLSRPNINACSLLTFPIVQYGTADKASDLPAGAGPYSYIKTVDGVSMVYNPNYYDGNARTASITLVDAAADASKVFSLKSERIDATFNDLYDGEILRLSATATVIPMANLVFLGVNANNTHTSSAVFRKLLSASLDRQSIVEHAFCGYAQATCLPVHPSWSALENEAFTDSKQADAEKADQLLKQYESGDDYESELSDGEEPEAEDLLKPEQTNYVLKLICCKGNDFKTGAAAQVSEQLSVANINVSVVELEEEAYYEAIREGNYDLYLGEVRMSADMDQSVFLVSGGSLGWGIDNESITCGAMWDAYCAGTVTLGDYLSAFAKELPFIPLCFRQGIFYTARSLVNEVFCTPENLYKNITVWEKALTEEP
ncbi:MAG: hypothetical protein IJC45_04550 [Clostridia bacterium]|nr:hypothetical protein [Clostridia bacterium]